MSTSQGFQINWLGSAGSALGAVSSAVLLSTLGAAGTIFGAALGSLVITVGGSIYTQSLQKTKDKVIGDRSGYSDAASERAGSTALSGEDLSGVSTDSGIAARRTLPWKRIIAITAGVFVAAMAAILIFEIAAGRPLSSYTGGSSETKSGTTFSDLGSSPADTGESGTEETGNPSEEPLSPDDPVKDEPAEQEPVEEDPAGEQPVEPPAAEQPPAAAEE